jgi:hypothetical protein
MVVGRAPLLHSHIVGPPSFSSTWHSELAPLLVTPCRRDCLKGASHHRHPLFPLTPLFRLSWTLSDNPSAFTPSTSYPPPTTGGTPPCRICTRSATASMVSASSKPSPANGPCPSPSPNAPGAVGLDTGHQSTLERRRRRQAPSPKLLPLPHRRTDHKVSPHRIDLARRTPPSLLMLVPATIALLIA